MYVTEKLQLGFMALLIIRRLAGIILLSNVYEMSTVLFITTPYVKNAFELIN